MKKYKTEKRWRKSCEEVADRIGREVIYNNDDSITIAYVDGNRIGSWNGVIGEVYAPENADYVKDERMTFGQLWNYQLFPRGFKMERAKQDAFLEACRAVLKEDHRLMKVDDLTFSVGFEQEGWVEVGQIWK